MTYNKLEILLSHIHNSCASCVSRALPSRDVGDYSHRVIYTKRAALRPYSQVRESIAYFFETFTPLPGPGLLSSVNWDPGGAT